VTLKICIVTKGILTMAETVLKRLLRRVQSTENQAEESTIPFSDRLKKLAGEWLNRNLLWMMNFYPPYLGAGIRIVEYRRDFRYIRVKMDLHWWNQNYVGTQFGGSLYSMCDPFYMLMVMDNLGSGYEVWDKSASIRFRNPGRGTVYADFELDGNDLARIREEVNKEGVSEPEYTVDVKNDDGTLIAEVEKQLHVTNRVAN
jgi:acyl-coenzyme A thioesterase PaaI-like protein